MKVLIVDDSSAMRMIVRRTLREAGYGNLEVLQAGDGNEALAAIHKDPPDLIFSDWNMPNKSGIELLEALNEEGCKIPFGFVTTESSAEMRARAAQTGAKFLITKPFTAEIFAKVLDAFLKKG
ncbi:MAG: response regulator [Candidatus Competibacter denitrificans]|jgi:two-component system chemotaxis response regulator CheY|uniref:Chemotaxis regulator CheY n=1 Tax=Candidatus Competibacter denitrificans Run_A_D11 TaxID=1400863 RepID=W6MD85_9GAMM|nr:response regulator [Candidatus Competibacter denitrificans]CDI02553.1 putative chemotaxis regulator CheY [Candidatus Competibacter denitrificans Run_A_D11]HRC69541.1 response regulator [Candidatus Competibacter denitrificans]